MSDHQACETLSSSNHEQGRGRRILWFVTLLIAAAFVSRLVAGLPPGWRRLMVTAGVLGVLAGAASGAWAKTLALPSDRGMMLLAACLGMSAAVGYHLFSYRLIQLQADARVQAEPHALLALSLMEKEANADPTLRSQLRRMKMTYGPTVEDYLAYRLSALGDWPPPWPALFAGCEVLFAGFVSGWLFTRTSSFSSPDRSGED